MNTKAIKHSLSTTLAMSYDELNFQIGNLDKLGDTVDSEKTTRKMTVSYCQQANAIARSIIRNAMSLMQEVEQVEIAAAEPDFETESKEDG